MIFADKYTSTAEAVQPGNDKKVVLSNETYATCELIDDLIKKIDKLRVALIR